MFSTFKDILLLLFPCTIHTNHEIFRFIKWCARYHKFYFLDYFILRGGIRFHLVNPLPVTMDKTPVLLAHMQYSKWVCVCGVCVCVLVCVLLPLSNWHPALEAEIGFCVMSDAKIHFDHIAFYDVQKFKIFFKIDKIVYTKLTVLVLSYWHNEQKLF